MMMRPPPDPVKELKALVQACEFMQSNAGYYKARSQTQIYPENWAGWSAQLRTAKKALKELEEHD